MSADLRRFILRRQADLVDPVVVVDMILVLVVGVGKWLVEQQQRHVVQLGQPEVVVGMWEDAVDGDLDFVTFDVGRVVFSGHD